SVPRDGDRPRLDERGALGAETAGPRLARARLGPGKRRQDAGLLVASEGRNRIALLGGRVDVLSVVRDDDRDRAGQGGAVGAEPAAPVLADAPRRAVELRELPGLLVAREDRDRIAVSRRDVHVSAVLADGDAESAEQAAAVGAGTTRAVFADAGGGARELRQ